MPEESYPCDWIAHELPEHTLENESEPESESEEDDEEDEDTQRLLEQYNKRIKGEGAVTDEELAELPQVKTDKAHSLFRVSRQRRRTGRCS